MKIQSMTGYGRAENGNFKVEARSLNFKTLDVQVKTPSFLFFCEPEIKKLVKEKFSRGRIEVFISVQLAETVRLKINKALAREYYDSLLALKKEFSIPGDIEINVLASQKDIFSYDEPEIEFTALRSAVEAAIDDLKKMRTEEGENLANDIAGRIRLLKDGVSRIEDKRSGFTANARKALADRLREILGDAMIDESRLLQEVAILIDRSDITEEIVRLKSHLKYIEDVLKSGDAVGRKLDFIIQEIHREINTIGSKAASTEISPVIVELKSELEKIREQVQNLQ
ncbi:MAG: YicC family protein [Nitrospirae bacterium]|nr:YicC family protein [Nitrospirota bacterium]